LGTPSIRCNSFVGKISYQKEIEKKYNLTFGFTPDLFQELKEKITELLSLPDLKEKWQERRRKLLDDKIDTTKFFLWLIDNIDHLNVNSFNSEFFKQFNNENNFCHRCAAKFYENCPIC